MSLFAAKKIVKDKGQDPEPFELDVAQALCDLEANSNDLKAELRELYIVSAKGARSPSALSLSLSLCRAARAAHGFRQGRALPSALARPQAPRSARARCGCLWTRRCAAPALASASRRLSCACAVRAVARPPRRGRAVG